MPLSMPLYTINAVTAINISAYITGEAGEVINEAKKPSPAAASACPLIYKTAYFVIQPPITA